MSVNELGTLLEPIPLAVMQTFVRRGILLSQRAGLESKRTNIETEKQAAIVGYDATISEITVAINQVQVQIDALGG